MYISTNDEKNTEGLKYLDTEIESLDFLWYPRACLWHIQPNYSVCVFCKTTEVEFLKSEELSLIKSSPLPAQLPRPGRS